MLEGYADVKEGDVLEFFRTKQVEKTLGVAAACRYALACSRVHLHQGESHGLKEKRKVVQSLKAQVRQRFGASVAEIDGQDTWQRDDAAVRAGRRRRRARRARTSWPGSSSRAVLRGAAFERDLLTPGGRAWMSTSARAMASGRMRRINEVLREVIGGAIATELRTPGSDS